MQAFAVFAFCWALSGLLDIAPFAAWFRSPTDTLFAASCLLVLLRPGSLWAFGAMNALRVAASLADSPENASFFAFSTGLLALYSLFVPGAVFQGAAAAAKRLREARDPRGWLYAPWTARAAAVGLVVGFGWVASLLRDPDAGIALPRAGFPALATLWVLGVLAVLAGLLLAREARPHWRERAPGRLGSAGVLLVFPLLVVLNGMSPYLGLRTVPAFSMFSNLRTEGGITNHLFMPATALRVASYQEDLVTILAVEDHGLRRFARRPRRTFFDLQRIVQKMALEQGKTDIAISFRRGGRRVVLRNAERDPDLMAGNPWLERKLLRFRAVPISRRRECSW